MKAAVYRGIGDIRVEDIEKPLIEEGELLVKVKACAICGGDLRTFRHGHNSIKTTQVYLNSIDISRINEANKRIIKRIGG